MQKNYIFFKLCITTWGDGSKFPPALRNHFETIGPPTNNHFKGYNFNISNETDSNHPKIFSLINTLNESEVLKSMDYVGPMNDVLLSLILGQNISKET